MPLLGRPSELRLVAVDDAVVIVDDDDDDDDDDASTPLDSSCHVLIFLAAERIRITIIMQ
jgi:hypothetical protein